MEDSQLRPLVCNDFTNRSREGWNQRKRMNIYCVFGNIKLVVLVFLRQGQLGLGYSVTSLVFFIIEASTPGHNCLLSYNCFLANPWKTPKSFHLPNNHLLLWVTSQGPKRITSCVAKQLVLVFPSSKVSNYFKQSNMRLAFIVSKTLEP